MYDTSKFKLTFPLSNGVSFELKDQLFRSENLFKQGNFFVKHPVSQIWILNVKCVILRLLSTPVTVTYALSIYVKLVPFKSSFLVQGPFFQYLTKNLVPFWSPFSQKSGPFLVP